MEPTDPRLAALYDGDNPDGPDHDYYRAAADQFAADVIVDLGCGTGLLTVTFATDGRTVVGIDPDQGMLDVAESRPGGGRVRWRRGDSRQIDLTADLVVMAGNVAQHIGPTDWHRTLSDVSAALRPNGRLVFETRNPEAAAWRSWTREQTLGTRSTEDGPLTEWVEASEPDATGTVVLAAMNRWEDAGEELVVVQSLTFRSQQSIEQDLDAVALVVDRVWGGWHGESVSATSPLLVVEARRI